MRSRYTQQSVRKSVTSKVGNTQRTYKKQQQQQLTVALQKARTVISNDCRCLLSARLQASDQKESEGMRLAAFRGSEAEGEAVAADRRRAPGVMIGAMFLDGRCTVQRLPSWSEVRITKKDGRERVGCSRE